MRPAVDEGSLPEDRRKSKFLTFYKELNKVPLYIPYKSYSGMASSSSSRSKKKLEEEFIYGPVIDRILIIEPEIMEKFPSGNPKEIAEYLLPDTHFFVTDNFNKSRKYYEQILVQTKSALFNYTESKGEIIYCKVLLINVITLKEWGQPPGKAKEFTLPNNGPVQKYNYWDYIDAWYRAFYFQNKKHTFSIFFHFANEFYFPLPNWFTAWWDTFGPNLGYLPTEVMKAFQKFETQYLIPEEVRKSQLWIVFAQQFRVPWILMTEFKVITEKSVASIYTSLCRYYKVKWWPKTDVSQCNEKSVDEFFIKYPTMSKFSKGKNELTKKDYFSEKRALLIAKIQSCTDDSQMEKLMDEFVKTKSVSDWDSDKGPDKLWDDTQAY